MEVSSGAEFFPHGAVVFLQDATIISSMRNLPPLDDKLNEAGGSPDRGHAEWKRAKVEAGLAQAQDRAAMIPLDTLLRELDLES